jgi:hypothetical protein
MISFEKSCLFRKKLFHLEVIERKEIILIGLRPEKRAKEILLFALFSGF